MSEKKTKLELTWIGKDHRPRLEPRILLEEPDLSFRSRAQPSASGSDNLIIHGDNLLALKALQQTYSSAIKCIYIDPPYNTGAAFEHYDDFLEHSTWLSLMRERLELLRSLLHPEGFLCCHIDDSEGHYLKVLLDEVMGRSNYQVSLYVQVRYPEKTLKQDMAFHKEVEQVLVYRRDAQAKPNRNQVAGSFEKFRWSVVERARGRRITLGGKDVDVFRPGEYEIVENEGSVRGLKEIWATGTILDGNSSGRFFRDFLASRVDADGLGALYKVSGIGDDGLGYRYFTGPRRQGATKGKYFQGVPTSKVDDEGAIQMLPIENFYDLAGAFGNCRHEGGVEFRSGKKPERLLEIVLRHFSNPGDLVLDSFAGSGTTGAVAHKMGRRWIMVELGDHARTHVVPRLRRVVEGKDETGITEAVAWNGGGGFRFYRLAPSLLERDRWGNWVITKSFNKEMLAEAMCKLEGFRYAPSSVLFWQHGQSTERDFIYVTTQTFTHEQLQAISDEVGPDRTLLICCAAFRARVDSFPNLTVKKIPETVLSRCEWRRDDYSLNVQNVMGEGEEVEPECPPVAGAAPQSGLRRKKKVAVQELPLFAPRGGK